MNIQEQLIQKAEKIIQNNCNENGYCALTLMDTERLFWNSMDFDV